MLFWYTREQCFRITDIYLISVFTLRSTQVKNPPRWSLTFIKGCVSSGISASRNRLTQYIVIQFIQLADHFILAHFQRIASNGFYKFSYTTSSRPTTHEVGLAPSSRPQSHDGASSGLGGGGIASSSISNHGN